MDVLLEFVIPVAGLKLGVHAFQFEVEDEFLSRFDGKIIEKGTFFVDALLDKKPYMYELTCSIEGKANTTCDRCSATIDLPLEGVQTYYFKFTEEEVENDDGEVIWIEPTIEQLNIAPWIHETIVLSMPMVKNYNCEDEEFPPCDFAVLEKMDPIKEVGDTSVWDILKDINKQ